tara:strand:+ start:4839 stop:5972 length:1134 start_codon:yes stop_codon:yes gene_type:complete
MQLTLDPDKFITQHWQKKPLFLKGAFPNFHDPLDADELAGMALEDFITSRVILRQGDQWIAKQGPFTDYSEFGSTHWQLLVQAVNHWVPQCQDIVNAFDFLPDWRVDDLMMSYCTPQGGVGPHIDQYDVFIIQGQGTRNWQVGAEGSYSLRKDIKHMAIIESFEPILDVTMQPGDLLYIPAGCPHQGITHTDAPALSYSLGFRAPLQRELLSSWADYLEEHQLASTRFTSPQDVTNSGLISETDQQAMVQLMKQSLSDTKSMKSMLGCLLSQSRFELNIEPLEQEAPEDLLEQLVAQHKTLYRIDGLKIICHEHDQPRVFIDQQEYILAEADQEQCYLLSNLKFYPPSLIETWLDMPQVKQLLLNLITQGYLYSDNE